MWCPWRAALLLFVLFCGATFYLVLRIDVCIHAPEHLSLFQAPSEVTFLSARGHKRGRDLPRGKLAAFLRRYAGQTLRAGFRVPRTGELAGGRVGSDGSIRYREAFGLRRSCFSVLWRDTAGTGKLEGTMEKDKSRRLDRSK